MLKTAITRGIRRLTGRVLILAVVLMLAAPALQPLQVYAAPSKSVTDVITEQDKTWMSGYFLMDVLNLIVDEYAGGPVTMEELYAATLQGIVDLLDEEDRKVLDDRDMSRMDDEYLTEFMDLILSEYSNETITPDLMYDAALYGMFSLLDPYSQYLSESDLWSFTGSLSGRLKGIGIVMRLNDDDSPVIFRVIPDSPAMKAGLRKGDIIISVNKTPVVGLSLDEVSDLIGDDSIERVRMEILRGMETLTFNMTKKEIASATVFVDRFEDIFGAEVAEATAAYRYVCVTSISESTADALRSAFEVMAQEGVTGIVIDFRGNPGGYLNVAEEICKMLVPRGPIYYTVNSKGRKKTVNSRLKESPFEKIVVLVDADSASAAELITAALQDSKVAVVIGETSYGKGVIQSIYSLYTGGAIKLTTEEYLRRSGKHLNGIGIEPDITIEMDIMEYETENDAALIKALEVLMEE